MALDYVGYVSRLGSFSSAFNIVKAMTVCCGVVPVVVNCVGKHGRASARKASLSWSVALLRSK